MGDNSPLRRQWLLLQLLTRRHAGVTLSEMAAELAIGHRTLRRDLALLAKLGFPVEETTGPRGRKTWRIGPAGEAPAIAFAFDEALALYLGRQFLAPLAGTYVWQAADSAFKKVRATLPGAALRYLDRMVRHVHISGITGNDYAAHAEMLDELVRAIEERKTTHIEYQSARATEPVTYEVNPYGIANHRGTLYLVAWSHEHDAIRHFKLQRTSAVEVEPFPFPLDADFDLAEHFAASFGIFGGAGSITVRIRFAPSAARYVAESRWHASQKLTHERDGSLVAEFELSSLEEIKSWTLSFGHQAEVLEPVELREQVITSLTATLATYDESSATSRQANETTRRPR